MESVLNIINQITEFGKNPDVDLPNKKAVLKRLLVELYAEFLKNEHEIDETDFDAHPKFDNKKIVKNVKSNFPEFGFYSKVLDSNSLEAEIIIGDEVDDLSDIIIDLLKVQWRVENTSPKDALWHFDLLMRIHSEQHLLDLLTRLKENGN